MTQIPIFRAKKLDSDEYVFGYLKHNKRYNHYCINPINEDNYWYVIDTTTLSIHVPDMLCSQGNKIFASLNKDGKGGDILEVYEGNRLLTTYTVKWDKCKTNSTSFDVRKRTTKKIIGIQN